MLGGAAFKMRPRLDTVLRSQVTQVIARYVRRYGGRPDSTAHRWACGTVLFIRVEAVKRFCESPVFYGKTLFRCCAS